MASPCGSQDRYNLDVGDCGYIPEDIFRHLFDGDHLSHENFGVPKPHQVLSPRIARHIDTSTLILESCHGVWRNLAFSRPGNPALLHPKSVVNW